MTSFREWLGQIGLAHCGQALLENGIDFDIVQDLTTDDLRSLGLTLGDIRRLQRAITRLGPQTAAALVDPAAVTDVPSKPIRASQGELRQLTVMFCDLVGYTALGQRLDHEELKGLIQTYYEVCAKVVRQYEGS